MSDLTVEEIKDISRDYYDAEETITGLQNKNIQLQAKVEELTEQNLAEYLKFCKIQTTLVTTIDELTAAIVNHKKEIELKIEGRIAPCPEDKKLWAALKGEL